MNRLIAIVAVVGLLIGILAGFLWWGMPTQRLQGELDAAGKRVEVLEKQLDEAQVQTRTAQAELKAVQGRLDTMEKDLRIVREQRAQLQSILSQGRK